MSTSKKKKVITTKAKKKKIVPTASRKAVKTKSVEMLFGRENFKWIFIGLALILLGMLLMMGGSMPSPDVWDDGRIYSFRRITLAPIVILTGLAIEIYAIFK